MVIFWDHEFHKLCYDSKKIKILTILQYKNTKNFAENYYL